MTTYFRSGLLFGLGIGSVCCAAGCGELYNKTVYEAATFTGPASGDYVRMMTGEQYAGSHIQHKDVVDVFIRFPDGAVHQLPKLLEEDLATRRPDRQTDASEMISCLISQPQASFHFRSGKLVGAAFAEGMELSKKKDGPFVALPLSAGQIRGLLGKPKSVSTFRGSFQWR